MYTIVYYENKYFESEKNMFTEMNKYVIEEMRPFSEKGVTQNYINYLYWALNCSTSGIIFFENVYILNN